jgi:hypothetical protein
MGLARLESKTQRLAGTEEVTLSYDFIERTRPQPFGERRRGFAFAEEIIH